MATTVNGSPLDSLDGVEAAFGYLAEDYNDGDIFRNIGGERVIITARSRRFQHFDALLEAHETPNHVNIVDMYATSDGKQRIEVSEQ